jgi:hypothetical protein
MYVSHNIQARAWYYFCRRKAVSIAYYEREGEWQRVFVPLLPGVQSACVVLYTHLWRVWLQQIFPYNLKKQQDLRKKVFVSVLIFSGTSVHNSSHFRIIQRIIIINVHTCLRNVLNILAIFSWNLDFLDRLSKGINIKIYLNRSRLNLFVSCGWTDRQT